MAAIDAQPDDEKNPPCAGIHTWSDWKIIGHTGDWFHPHIIKRKCAMCPATEQYED